MRKEEYPDEENQEDIGLDAVLVLAVRKFACVCTNRLCNG